MNKQAKTNNFNYLINPTFNKVTDYLSHHLKTKMIDFLFQSNFLYQMLKQNIFFITKC